MLPFSSQAQINWSNLSTAKQSALFGKYYKKYKKFLNPNAELIALSINSSLEKRGLQFIEKRYNQDKKIITHKIHYSDSTFTKKDGLFINWFDNGEVWIKGHYSNNDTTGKWQYYDYKTRNLTEGNYVKGKKDGKWIEQDAEKRTVEVMHYKNGKLDGKFNSFDSLGNIVVKRIYVKDSLVNFELIDSNFIDYMAGKPDTYAILNLWGYPKDDPLKPSYNTVTAYLYRKINYPSSARIKGTEGTVAFAFIVNEDGKIEEITTYNGLSNAIEKECLKRLKKLRAWQPATYNNKNVKMGYVIPLRFKLE